MPMHPTNKHLRITYVHEVNNNKTHLSSMSHTLNPLHMHCSISHYNTHCRMAYGHSNMFLGHDWVTPSRIFFLVIRPSFSFLARIYYSNEYTQSQSHLSLAWMVKNRLLLGLRVYIGIFTYGKFSQILFLPWVETWLTSITTVRLLCSIHLYPCYIHFMVGMTSFHVVNLESSWVCSHLFIKEDNC